MQLCSDAGGLSMLSCSGTPSESFSPNPATTCDNDETSGTPFTAVMRSKVCSPAAAALLPGSTLVTRPADLMHVMPRGPCPRGTVMVNVSLASL